MKCPKYLLSPGFNYGLHPGNALAVQLYYQAARDHRVGMEGVLIGTLTASDAWAVIEIYDEHLPTSRDKQKCFELMMILDQLATKYRGDEESRIREMRDTAAKNRR